MKATETRMPAHLAHATRIYSWACIPFLVDGQGRWRAQETLFFRSQEKAEKHGQAHAGANYVVGQVAQPERLPLTVGA